MKFLKKGLLIVLILLFCSACGSSSNLKSLSYSEFKDKIENKETFFFVVIRDGCTYCESFEPKMEEVVNEYDIIGYTLNVSDMSDSEYQEFIKEYNIDGTPQTIFITEGHEVSLLQRIDGNVSKEKIISKLKSNNYIQ